MRRCLMLGLLLSVIACARLDRTLIGERFEPLGTVDGEVYFRYVTFANVPYPLDSPRAEAKRMAWLEELLADNGYAGRPYRIVSREPIARRVVGGTMYDVYYHVAVLLPSP
jgi:hypothetical protein